MSRRPSPIAKIAGSAPPPKLPISPLVGEMSGRTEGGAVERQSCLRSKAKNENGRDEPGHFLNPCRTDYGLIGAYFPSCHWLMS